MPRYTDYSCGTCKKDWNDDPDPQSKLARKIVTFQKMGPKGKVIRSRTTQFICIEGCMPLDRDFARGAHDAPGMRSPARERVRAAERLEHGESG